MRIVIDVRCLLDQKTSGVEEYTLQILKALFASDSETTYILFSSGYLNSRQSNGSSGFEWIQKYPNVKHVHVKIPNKILNFAFWYLEWPKIDKLVGGADMCFAPNIQFLPLSKDVRFVLTLHDLSYVLYPHTFSLKRRLWHAFVNPRRLSKRAESIIAVSHSSAEDAKAYFSVSNKKINVISNALPESFCSVNRNDALLLRVQKKYKLPYEFILSLGVVEPRKNVVATIRGYEALRRRLGTQGNKYKLVIAGAVGWKARAFRYAYYHSKYRKDILLLGYVNDADKAALYTLAKIFLYPSFYEGFGFPLLEAARTGTPVVCANSSSLPEVMGEAAIYIDPFKPEEIARALGELLEDKDLYERMRERGVSHSRKFRWSNAGRATKNILLQTA